MTLFVTKLAWIFGTLSTLLVVLRIIAWGLYSDLDQLVDATHGVERTFPVVVPGIIAIICWTWILTF